MGSSPISSSKTGFGQSVAWSQDVTSFAAPPELVFGDHDYTIH